MTVETPSIYLDFNDHDGRYLFLQCNGTKANLQKFAIVLEEGLVLRVSDGNLAATGTVTSSAEHSQWVIDVDPRDVVDLHD